jgi:hypothetical protein
MTIRLEKIPCHIDLRKRLERFLKLPFAGNEKRWLALAKLLGLDLVAVEELAKFVHKGDWRRSTALRTRLNGWVRGTNEAHQDDFDDTGRRRYRIADPEKCFTDCAPNNPNITADARSYGWKLVLPDSGRLGNSKRVPSLDAQLRAGKSSAVQRERAAQVSIEDLEKTTVLDTIQDEAERRVIRARALGISRHRLLSGTTEPTERRRLQAAWRALNRNRTLPLLRRTLLAVTQHDRREDRREESGSYGCGSGKRKMVLPNMDDNDGDGTFDEIVPKA